MNTDTFDPLQYYSSYPSKVISRPGYSARAAYKSTFIFGLYGQRIKQEIGTITTYADIGGCFGFGANAMAFQILKQQDTPPKTVVFEIASEFVRIGKMLFPHIEFIEANFSVWNGHVRYFDLISMFDVIEHVVNPKSFLQEVSSRGKYLVLKTPMETSGDWRGSMPPDKQGQNHVDGHINFFTPETYERLLDESNFDVLESILVPTIVPRSALAILVPEQTDQARFLSSFRTPKRFLTNMLRNFPVIPWKLKRKIFGGGDHICLCKSRSF